VLTETDRRVFSVVGIAIAATALWWLWYAFGFAPSHRSESGAPPEVVMTDTRTNSSTHRGKPDEAVVAALAQGVVPRSVE
jgi:hypothetical protein